MLSAHYIFRRLLFLQIYLHFLIFEPNIHEQVQHFYKYETRAHISALYLQTN